jgi:hypothetical protein
MMVVIEYLNVLTRGRWQSLIGRWRWGQVVLCSLLGAIPGCLGAFAVTSLYMHRVVTVGAAVAAMIATCGDEAFVMLALFPGRALLIMALLFALGVVSGWLVDIALKARRTAPSVHLAHYQPAHPDEMTCVPLSFSRLVSEWRNCTPHRGWLTALLLLFLVGVCSGKLGHRHFTSAADARPLVEHGIERDVTPGHAEGDHDTRHGAAESAAGLDDDTHAHGEDWNWVRVTLLLLVLTALLVVATVPDHFLDEHLWNHIARVHIGRIFLWTLGALLVTHALSARLDAGSVVQAHHLPLLLVACLMGLIPESGPHLVFVALYAEGSAPFSTLLASSIVQDGHGMIPMLAHSRRAFILIKAINLAVGLAVGLAGWFLGW